MYKVGKGQNYKNQKIEIQKEHQKCFKASEHQKCLFSSSLLRQKTDFRCSDFTYGVKKDQNIKNRNINYLWRITYGYQALWGPGGLG